MGSVNRSAGLIPVIDLSGPENDVAKELVDAAATYGFVYIKSLGKDIPIDAIDSIFDLSKKFFSSPIEEKQPCKISENVRPTQFKQSYVTDTLERTEDGSACTPRPSTPRTKRAMNLGEFINGKAQQPLPPVFAPREAELDQFQKYCQSLMLKILNLFAIGLEIDPALGGSDWFSSRHRGTDPSSCTLRLLHYPPLPPDTNLESVDVRAGAHSDYGSITLLFQRPGQPGLEIIPPSTMDPSAPRNYTNTASWTPVPVFPPGTESDPSPPILVNIGDLLSYWTNNLLKSTVHRVIFPSSASSTTTTPPTSDRYSIAYFGHPIGNTVLEPVPSERVRAAGKGQVEGASLRAETGVEAMTANEHLMSRLKATYLGLYRDGEEKGGKGKGEVAAA